jgi:hypothetical protein
VAGKLRPITDGLHLLIEEIANKVRQIAAEDDAVGESLINRLDNTIMPVLQNNYPNVAQEDLEVIAATVLLGPQRAEAPPLPLLRELLDLKRRYPRTHYSQIAIKYGTLPQHRRWNNKNRHDSRWDNVWPSAKEELSKLVSYALTAVYQQLKNVLHIAGLPYRPMYDIEGDAEILTNRLLEPLSLPIHADNVVIKSLPDLTEVKAGVWQSNIPPGARRVLTVNGQRGNNILICWPDGSKTIIQNNAKVIIKTAEAYTTIRIEPRPHGRIPKIWEWNEVRITNIDNIQVWECTCGKNFCKIQHRLEAWDPDVVPNLHSFINSAMGGPIPIRTGGFAGSMYFSLLNEDGQDLRLRFEEVEFKRCLKCPSFFEQNQCICGFQFVPQLTNKFTRKLIIVVNPAVYIPVDRIRCSNKPEHYKVITNTTAPNGLNAEWDNLFDTPGGLSDIIKTLHWPDEMLNELADEADMNIQMLKMKLNGTKEQMRQNLRCPLCGQTGVENPAFRPSVVFVRAPWLIYPLNAQGDIEYQPQGD